MANYIDQTRGARGAHLRLLLADGCNLRCDYCHFHANQDQQSKGSGERALRRVMMADSAVVAVHAFAAAMQQRGESHFDLSLYGGEPLINPKALEAAFTATEAVRRSGMAVTPIVNTNATLINANIAFRFAQVGARAHVSLDGVDFVTNSRRRLHSGAASLDAVLRGLTTLQHAGVRMQLNVVLSDSNLEQIASLMPLAQQVGCDQVFFALPDLTSGGGIGRPEHYLSALLNARVAAQRHGLRAIGPWSIGLRAQQVTTELPWNLVVRTDAKVFVPHFPDQLFDCIDTLLAPEHWTELERAWQMVRNTCHGCELESHCRGYLKMMTRYHAGSQTDASTECEFAKRATTMLNDPYHHMLRTALSAHVEAGTDGEYRLLHPRLSGDAIEVTDGVLELLDFFLPGTTRQAAADHFDTDQLDDSLEVLINLGILQAVDAGDDQQHFEQLLGSRGDIVAYAGLLIGAADPALLQESSALRPHFEAAIARLPLRLQSGVDRCCIFLASDGAGFARVAGLPADAPWLDWMAGTVAYGVLLLNHAACAAVLAHGGRNRLRRFEQQLSHELLHLVLRQRGLRLPVWLEEGLCEYYSGAELSEVRLREALAYADDFIAFVQTCMDPLSADARWNPETALLGFSDAPVDENPGYALAHDLVQQLANELGDDGLLDILSERGLRARRTPFPLREGADGLAGLMFDELLAHWRAGLQQRLSPVPQFTRPMRVVVHGQQALVYNRIVGGHAWIDNANVAAHGALTDINLEVDQIADLLVGHPDADQLLSKWQASQFARQHGYHLRLTLEGGCNMSCSYCYEGDKKRQAMSIATADQAVAAWRDLLEPGDLPGSSIRLFGGEPFMNWPVMKHVFETATVGLPKNSVQWYLNTNGTLIRDKHVDFLAKFSPQLLVHLSLDGVAAVNDRDRIFNNQLGTFAHVDRTARKLIKVGIPLNIAVTLTPHNAHGLPELLCYVAELRALNSASVVSISIKPVIGPDLSSVDAQLMLAALEMALEQSDKLGLDVGGEPLRAANLLFQASTPTGHFCGVSGRELYVTPEGRLMVCHAIPGSEYSNLAEVAQIHHIPVPVDVATRHAGHIDGCSGCEVEGLCGGGCMAQSKAATGLLARKPSDYFCQMMKTTFRNAVLQGLQARAIS